MRVTVRLFGFKELNSMLAELPNATRRRIVGPATREALEKVRPLIRAQAPIDRAGRSEASRKYGRLRENIRTQRLHKKLNRRYQVGARIYTNNAFWGYFQEVGTSHGIKPKRWMENAMRRTQSETIAALKARMAVRFSKVLDQKVREVNRGGRRKSSV